MENSFCLASSLAEFARAAGQVSVQRIVEVALIAVVSATLVFAAQPMPAHGSGAQGGVICPNGRQCLDDLRPRIPGIFP